MFVGWHYGTRTSGVSCVEHSEFVVVNIRSNYRTTLKERTTVSPVAITLREEQGGWKVDLDQSPGVLQIKDAIENDVASVKVQIADISKTINAAKASRRAKLPSKNAGQVRNGATSSGASKNSSSPKATTCKTCSGSGKVWKYAEGQCTKCGGLNPQTHDPGAEPCRNCTRGFFARPGWTKERRWLHCPDCDTYVAPIDIMTGAAFAPKK